tara:strand:+ start:327 stop:575 length:249 start_codon:yes stop_codon:yes gene_type:complete
MAKKSEQVVNITDIISVDLKMLREQRNTLLEVVEVLASSRRDDIEDFFAFDRNEASEKIEGVISLLDTLLDEAEGYGHIHSR